MIEKIEIGLESESMHLWLQNGFMDIFSYIDFAKELGFDGVVINIIKDYGLDDEWGALGNDKTEHLEKIASKLKSYNMFCEIDSKGFEVEKFKKILRVCDILGANILRTYVPLTDKNKKKKLAMKDKISHAKDGAYDDSKIDARFDKAEFMESINDIKTIIPLLEKSNVKIAIENHEYQTSNEIMELLNQINHPHVKALFDFGNSMMCYEEPIKACQNMSKSTISTHVKDHIVFLEDDVPYVAGVTLGQGNIDLKSIVKTLLDSGLRRFNIEQCYPYCATFKREAGTGGVAKLGNGAFKIEKALFDGLKAMEYYYPQSVSKEALDKLLHIQRQGVKDGFAYFKNLIKEVQ